MSKPELSILMPTHNRDSFTSALCSVMEIFQDQLQSGFAEIIVGDNSTPMKHNWAEVYVQGLKDSIERTQQPVSLTYLNNKKVPQFLNFSRMIDATRGRFVLVVEDDDTLLGGKGSAHDFLFSNENTWKLLTSRDCGAISYRWVDYEGTNGINFGPRPKVSQAIVHHMSTSYEGKHFPEIWNGSYQIGCSYIRTDLLKKAIKEWFFERYTENDTSIRGYRKSIDGSNDEALYVLSIWAVPTVYINLPGVIIGKNGDNASWGNPALSLYSSRSYIDDIGIYRYYPLNSPSFREDIQVWTEAMKSIVLRELQTMFDFQLEAKDVFDSSQLQSIEEKVAARCREDYESEKGSAGARKLAEDLTQAYINTLRASKTRSR